MHSRGPGHSACPRFGRTIIVSALSAGACRDAFTGECRVGSVRFARVWSQAYPAVYVRVKLPVDSKLSGLITTVVLPAWSGSGVKSTSVR